MALENKFSWITLASMLDQMTPTLSQSKELVKVLLNEFQKFQRKHHKCFLDKTFANELYHQNDDNEVLEESKPDVQENGEVEKDTKDHDLSLDNHENTFEYDTDILDNHIDMKSVTKRMKLILMNKTLMNLLSQLKNMKSMSVLQEKNHNQEFQKNF